MRAIFASGRIVDIALALTALEAVGVLAYHRATGRGVPAADFLGNLLSGICLMVALRVALGGGWWGWIAAALLAALLAHLWDLHRRWT